MTFLIEVRNELWEHCAKGCVVRRDFAFGVGSKNNNPSFFAAHSAVFDNLFKLLWFNQG